MSRSLRIIVREITKQGFECRVTRRGHLLVLKNGQVAASFAGTPSDYRSYKNSLASLRRAGFVGALPL